MAIPGERVGIKSVTSPQEVVQGKMCLPGEAALWGAARIWLALLAITPPPGFKDSVVSTGTHKGFRSQVLVVKM